MYRSVRYVQPEKCVGGGYADVLRSDCSYFSFCFADCQVLLDI